MAQDQYLFHVISHFFPHTWHTPPHKNIGSIAAAGAWEHSLSPAFTGPVAVTRPVQGCAAGKDPVQDRGGRERNRPEPGGARTEPVQERLTGTARGKRTLQGPGPGAPQVTGASRTWCPPTDRYFPGQCRSFTFALRVADPVEAGDQSDGYE
ncbi:MAG TPA: hypothetical protein PLN56_06485 [Methanoregulaceae archaeon]|nr:hypothetical protein [Methanoregulaceae archaeon]